MRCHILHSLEDVQKHYLIDNVHIALSSRSSILDRTLPGVRLSNLVMVPLIWYTNIFTPFMSYKKKG